MQCARVHLITAVDYSSLCHCSLNSTPFLFCFLTPKSMSLNYSTLIFTYITTIFRLETSVQVCDLCMLPLQTRFGCGQPSLATETFLSSYSNPPKLASQNQQAPSWVTFFLDPRFPTIFSDHFWNFSTPSGRPPSVTSLPYKTHKTFIFVLCPYASTSVLS